MIKRTDLKYENLPLRFLQISEMLGHLEIILKHKKFPSTGLSFNNLPDENESMELFFLVDPTNNFQIFGYKVNIKKYRPRVKNDPLLLLHY